MKTNLRPRAVQTTNHEGTRTLEHTSVIDRLRRTVCACMLWEDNFYESGQTVADRIKELVKFARPDLVAALAIEAREKMNLRHVPLLLVRELARYPSRFSVAETLGRIIQRPDELAEFLSIYWDKKEPFKGVKDRTPIANQVKKGLDRAFRKFDEYQLAKYASRPATVKLRDVLRLVRPKPSTVEQEALWNRLYKDELAPPGTWEQRLSAGEDKKAVFTDLLQRGKLGYLALLRNLRNMHDAGVDEGLVEAALMLRAGAEKVLPFRYIAAARAVPQWEDMIDRAMQSALDGMEKLPGHTIVVVDTSPSMTDPISDKSDLTRMDAACALAILLRGICEKVTVMAFSSVSAVVAPRTGMALADAIKGAVPSNGTLLGAALRAAAKAAPNADRMIVFTDEEPSDEVPAPHCKSYMVNVATTERSVAREGNWAARITGFSEAVISYIRASEKLDEELEGLSNANAA